MCFGVLRLTSAASAAVYGDWFGAEMWTVSRLLYHIS